MLLKQTAAVHGLTRGIITVVQGGKFGAGFASGFVSSGFSVGRNWGTVESRTFVMAMVGGATSEITGGKFANGAVTGAFVHLFNAEWKWSQIKEGIQHAIKIGPYDTYKVKKILELALDKTNSYIKQGILYGATDGPADAYRHCFLSCQLAKEIGYDQALEWGNNHELWNYNPSNGASTMMDLNNNFVGRGFASIYQSCDVASLNAVLNYNSNTSSIFIMRP